MRLRQRQLGTNRRTIHMYVTQYQTAIASEKRTPGECCETEYGSVCWLPRWQYRRGENCEPTGVVLQQRSATGVAQ